MWTSGHKPIGYIVSQALKICKCLWSLSCGGVSNMLLVLSVTSHCHYNISGCMCNYHHQIGSINLTHYYHNFQWLCAWDVCYVIFCHILHVQSGKTEILFSLLLCNLRWVQIVGNVLACRSCSFVSTLHHIIIMIVQTYLKTLNWKCLSDIFCRVCE